MATTEVASTASMASTETMTSMASMETTTAMKTTTASCAGYKDNFYKGVNFADGGAGKYAVLYDVEPEEKNVLRVNTIVYISANFCLITAIFNARMWTILSTASLKLLGFQLACRTEGEAFNACAIGVQKCSNKPARNVWKLFSFSAHAWTQNNNNCDPFYCCNS
eukprot:2318150-Pleurochrysis_carterae.AAC.1